ncbi:AAA family ATPase [Lonepinella koalarum]|uniref:AAA family ATPase n=1 Tax=Lonepinella koalarum TaxID=53417 RepID=UPI0011E3D755|nr:AAA family ATPase [Lonepinella koalarum]TYG34189.1 AAA family ATPase [Lonepinella koalarum]
MPLNTQIKQLLTTGQITQTDLAQQAGISTSALSTYLKGTYKGNVENVEKSLALWLETQTKKQQVFVEAPQFIETQTAKNVFYTLDMARLMQTSITVYGASGVGKTKACREYTQRNNNVWMVTSSPSRSSLGAILYDIALTLGVNNPPRRKDNLSRLVISKLEGTQGLVIIDESDHLTYEALEEIRFIQEKADVGFAFIGNIEVYTKIQGGVNQASKYARVWSRIGKHYEIKASRKDDIKAIMAAWGLDTTDKDLMKVACEIGGKAGSLRILTQYLRLAGITAKGQGTAITLELILQAQAQMKGAN